MNTVLAYLSGGLVILGALVIIIGLVGVYRMPDFYTRLHAASVIDTLGSMLIVSGLMLIGGLSLISVKLLLILMFILITTPAAAHALAKSALHGQLEPKLDSTES